MGGDSECATVFLRRSGVVSDISYSGDQTEGNVINVSRYV